MPPLPRPPRGKKKSELASPPLPPGESSRVSVTSHIVHPPSHADAARAHGIDPAAAAAVLGTQPLSPEDAAAPPTAEDDAEENIYEVMKQHMRRKQEELEAKNAQMRQQRAAGQGGRPGPAGRPAAPQPAPEPEIPRVADLANLDAVWAAARQYMLAKARIIESVLGGCTRILSLTTNPPEAVLEMPSTQKGFANERARLKLEEILRLLTGLPLKVRLEFVEVARRPAHAADAGMPAAPAATVQRVPPEIIDAVKKQPVIQELMKRFDATVTQIELLGTGDE